jgi:hypothetical protein
VKYRCMDLKGARGHDFLFVEIKEGKEMAIATADDIYKILKQKIPFTHHLLRHTWNDRFSQLADEKIANHEWTRLDEDKARKEKMGWTPRSRMPELYSKRHIITESNKVSMELQRRIFR